jgi:hypothetical protein
MFLIFFYRIGPFPFIARCCTKDYPVPGTNFVIPKGTPMMQVIPFKRENWESKILRGTQFERDKNYILLSRRIHSAYIKMFRDKKTYL